MTLTVMSEVVSFRLNSKEIDRLVQLCSRLGRSQIRGTTWIKVHGQKMTRSVNGGKLYAPKSESCKLEIQFCSADCNFVYYNWGAARTSGTQISLPSSDTASEGKLATPMEESKGGSVAPMVPTEGVKGGPAVSTIPLTFDFDKLKLKEWMFKKSINPIDILAIYDQAKSKLTYKMKMMAPEGADGPIVYDEDGMPMPRSNKLKLQVLKLVEEYKAPDASHHSGGWLKLPKKLPTGISPSHALLTDTIRSVCSWRSVKTPVRSRRATSAPVLIDVVPSAEDVAASAAVRDVNSGKYLRLQLSRSRGLRVHRSLASKTSSSVDVKKLTKLLSKTSIDSSVTNNTVDEQSHKKPKSQDQAAKHKRKRQRSHFYNKLSLINGLCLTIPSPIIGETGVPGGVRVVSPIVDIAIGKRGLLYFYSPSASSHSTDIADRDSISLLTVHPFCLPKQPK
jgi:hypothetical protein